MFLPLYIVYHFCVLLSNKKGPRLRKIEDLREEERVPACEVLNFLRHADLPDQVKIGVGRDF